jgi:hypothetical protein
MAKRNQKKKREEDNSSPSETLTKEKFENLLRKAINNSPEEKRPSQTTDKT